jgi:plastocyanin
MTRLALPLALVASWSSVSAAGSVKGTVLFEGEPPTQPTLERKSDPRCARGRQDEAVVVTKGKLRDVMVRIKNGSTGNHVPLAAPAAPATLDQQDCMYTPRVVGLVAGQKLALRNSDNTFHNVHGTLMGKEVFNKPMPAKAADLTVDPSVAHAGDVVALQCDVHPWMKAYAVVNDSPFFAVTGADGSFELRDLPIGDYTLEAWHPVLGARSIKISIGKGKRGDVTARFSYKQSEM